MELSPVNWVTVVLGNDWNYGDSWVINWWRYYRCSRVVDGWCHNWIHWNHYWITFHILLAKFIPGSNSSRSTITNNFSTEALDFVCEPNFVLIINEYLVECTHEGCTQGPLITFWILLRFYKKSTELLWSCLSIVDLWYSVLKSTYANCYIAQIIV